MIHVKDQTQLVLFGQETERLLFRKLEESDFDTWLQFCEDPDSLKYFAFKQTDSGEEKCRQWFDKIQWRYANNAGGMNVLIDKDSGEFIGQCGLLVQKVDEQEELEIGYSLMPGARGLGYALEAAQKCRDLAFQNNFTDSLISIIHPGNHTSKRVASNNGMQHSKHTLFNQMPVDIYRITKEEWGKINQQK